jgi:ribonuclease Z
MFNITFLGTSDAIPSLERNHTSIFLETQNENILIDCGEGTQRQFRKAKLNPCKITRILITHWHGDHVLGLPGILQTLSFSGYNKKLFIYGPKGTKEFMKTLLKTFIFQGECDINVEEVSGKFLETQDFYIAAQSMTHGIPCNAYTFVQKEKIRINKDKLAKTKLKGPILQKFQEGKDINFEGKKYLAKNFTFKEAEKKSSFVLDTSFNKEIIPFVKNSDLLICESTFGEDFKEKAGEYNHLSVDKTAEIAKKANCKKLVLTHISQRYSKNLDVILKSAKKIFKESFLAKDFDKIEIK